MKCTTLSQANKNCNDGDDVPHMAFFGGQIDACQFILVGGLDLYLLFFIIQFQQISFQLLRRRVVITGGRLRLEQHDGTDVPAA